MMICALLLPSKARLQGMSPTSTPQSWVKVTVGAVSGTSAGRLEK